MFNGIFFCSASALAASFLGSLCNLFTPLPLKFGIPKSVNVFSCSGVAHPKT